jgi:hypothetical protein
MTGSTETSTDGRDDAGVATELSRDMGLADITFIGVGAMIGAGIFGGRGSRGGSGGPATAGREPVRSGQSSPAALTRRSERGPSSSTVGRRSLR